MWYDLHFENHSGICKECRGAKGSREPCEKVISVVHGYSGAREK